MLDTYRAIASTRHTDHRHNWQPTLHTLTNRLPDTTAADISTLTDDINARTDRRHVNELLDNLTAEQTENLHTAITASTANSAADLARAWQNVTTPDGLIPALPKPAGSWAGTVTTTTTPPPPAPPPAHVIHHPTPPAPDTLDQWLTITDPTESHHYLDTHQHDLLTDDTYRRLHTRETPSAPHHALLTLAQYGHINDAYQYLHADTPHADTPATSAPTNRQQHLTRLLTRPELADPTAVKALADLAYHHPDPTPGADADADILHLTAGILDDQPVNIDLAALTDAHHNLTPDQRKHWADTLNTLATNTTTPAHQTALHTLANHLRPTIEIDAELWRPKPGVDPLDGGGPGRLFGELIAVRYELVPAPDSWTIRRRLYVEGQPDAVEQVQEATQAGVDALNENPPTLPEVGKELRWEVRFVDDRDSAHQVVTVGAPGSETNQRHWAAGETPAVYVHEVVHGAGVPDRKDASLMGPHKHDAVLSLSAKDLQDIVDVLKPHYAGVVGSDGPAVRPEGAASAAQGPASAQKVWEAGHAVPPGFPGYESDDAGGFNRFSTVPPEALDFSTPRLSPKLEPDESAGSAGVVPAGQSQDPADLVMTDVPSPQQPMPDAAGTGGIDAPVGVPDDRSLLSAFVAENPLWVGKFLRPDLDADLAGFLSDPDGVRAELGRGGGPRLARVSTFLQDRVGHWLVESRAGLPAEVLRQRVGSGSAASARRFLLPSLADATRSRIRVVESTGEGLRLVEAYGPSEGRRVTLLDDPDNPGHYIPAGVVTREDVVGFRPVKGGPSLRAWLADRRLLAGIELLDEGRTVEVIKLPREGPAEGPLRDWVNDWVKSLNVLRGPHGHPYSPLLVDLWSGGLISEGSVTLSWVDEPQVDGGGEQQGPDPTARERWLEEREQWLERMVAFQPGDNGPSNLKEFLESQQERPEWISLERRGRLLNEHTRHLLRDWARTKKALTQADVATLSGDLISQAGVYRAWKEDAGGSQPYSGPLPEGFGAPSGSHPRPRQLNDEENRRLNDEEIRVLSYVALGETNSEIVARLGLTLASVKWRVAEVNRKLRVEKQLGAVQKRLSAVAEARRLGWLPADNAAQGSASVAASGGAAVGGGTGLVSVVGPDQSHQASPFSGEAIEAVADRWQPMPGRPEVDSGGRAGSELSEGEEAPPSQDIEMTGNFSPHSSPGAMSERRLVAPVADMGGVDAPDPASVAALEHGAGQSAGGEGGGGQSPDTSDVEMTDVSPQQALPGATETGAINEPDPFLGAAFGSDGLPVQDYSALDGPERSLGGRAWSPTADELATVALRDIEMTGRFPTAPVAMSTDFGQSSIDDQVGENLGASHEPPTTPTTLHPDQPQPQPTAGSQLARARAAAQELFDRHIATARQKAALGGLWNALIGHMDENGNIAVGSSTLARETSTKQPTVSSRIKVLLGSGLLQRADEGHSGGVARYRVGDPDQPSLPNLPEGRQWVRDKDEARELFDQHAGHIATGSQVPLKRLWNALIAVMEDGIITASEADLAKKASTEQQRVNDLIRVLLDRGLLQLDRQGQGGRAARYRVTTPGRPPLPALPAGRRRVHGRNEARPLYDQHVAPTMRQPKPLRAFWNELINVMDDNGIIIASGLVGRGISKSTVSRHIQKLLGSGLLYLVQESRGTAAAVYRVSDPGREVEIDAELWRPKPGVNPFALEDVPFDGSGVRGGKGGPGRLFGELVAVRFALADGDEWLIQRRLYVKGPKDAVEQVMRDTLAGVDELNKSQLKLPEVDKPLRWEVRFVDDPDLAHQEVTVVAAGSETDQWRWAAGAKPAVYVHEVVHGAGVPDREDASLMGPHKHDAVLSLSEKDLQDIVNVLKPHYAGVVGSNGPAVRPQGAASAAQGPASAQEVWKAGHAVPPGFPGYESGDDGGWDPSTVPRDELDLSTPKMPPKDLEPGPQQPAPDAAGPDAIHAPDPAHAAEEPTAQGLLPVEAYVTREAVVGFRPGADGENLRAWLADRLPARLLPDVGQRAKGTLREWVDDWAKSLNGQPDPDGFFYSLRSVVSWSGGLISHSAVARLWRKKDAGSQSGPVRLTKEQKKLLKEMVAFEPSHGGPRNLLEFLETKAKLPEGISLKRKHNVLNDTTAYLMQEWARRVERRRTTAGGDRISMKTLAAGLISKNAIREARRTGRAAVVGGVGGGGQSQDTADLEMTGVPGPQQPLPGAAGTGAIDAPGPFGGQWDLGGRAWSPASEELEGLAPGDIEMTDIPSPQEGPRVTLLDDPDNPGHYLPATIIRQDVVGFRPVEGGRNLREMLAIRQLPDGIELPDEGQTAEETLREWVNDWAKSLNGQPGPDDRPYDPDSVEFWSGGLIPQTSVWNLWQKMPDVGGSPIQLIQEQSTSRDGIEMTDYPGPQQPSPGATAWDGIDAFDPAGVSASGGSAVGGGAGLVSVVGPDQSHQVPPFSVEAIEVDADRWQPLPGGQRVDAAEVDAPGRAGAMAFGDDGPPPLNYVAFGEGGADRGRLEVDPGGRVLSALSEGRDTPSPQDAEMTGYSSPQHSSPDATGMGGIDASGPAGVAASGGGDVPPLGYRAAGEDGRAWSALSALVAEDPAGVGKLLGSVLDADLVEFLSVPDGVRAELGRGGGPDGARLARVSTFLQVRVGRWLAENRAGLPAEVLRQRVFLPYLGQRAQELQEQDPAQVLRLLQAGVGDRVVDARFLDPVEIENRYTAARAELGLMLAPWTDVPQERLDFLNAHDRGFLMGERFLLPLLAHAAGVRITVLESAGEGPRLVEAYGPSEGRRVTLLNDPDNPGHYIPATIIRQDVVGFRPVEGGRNLREMLAIRQLPDGIELPDEGQTAGGTLREWVNDWARSLNGQLDPDGHHPYVTSSVARWSGGLIPQSSVQDLWQKMPQVDLGGSQPGPVQLTAEQDLLRKMVAFNPGDNGASNLKEFLATIEIPEGISLERRYGALTGRMGYLVEEWARMMKDKLVASGRPGIYSMDLLYNDIATLSGGLISKKRVRLVLSANAGGSQSRSGQLPEASGAPGVGQAQLPFGQDASASGAAVVGGVSQGPGAGQSTGGMGEGWRSQHTAAFEMTDNPSPQPSSPDVMTMGGIDASDAASAASGDGDLPLLGYRASGEDGRAWSALSDGWDTPSPRNIEMTDYSSPQHASPDATGMDGIDAPDPGHAAASEGSAVGAGAGAPAVGPDQSAKPVILTPEEIRVLDHMATGLTYAEIGKLMGGRSGRAVSKMGRRLNHELGVGTRWEAVAEARRRGLLPDSTVRDVASAATSGGPTVGAGAGSASAVGPGQSASGPHLTPRQKEVLHHVEWGRETSDIAEQLGLSKETVRDHLNWAMRALGMRGLGKKRWRDVAAEARRLNLLPGDAPVAASRDSAPGQSASDVKLSSTQLSALYRVAAGRTTDVRVIGPEIGRAPITVGDQLRLAAKELGVDSWEAAAEKARELGLLHLPPVEIDAELWRPKRGAHPFDDDRRGPGRLFGELVAVRYELVPGLDRWTIRRRLYVEGQPDAVKQVQEATQAGVAELNKSEPTLPEVDKRLWWEVEFVNNSKLAHQEVTVVGAGEETDQWRWAAGAKPAVYVHEVVHGAGVPDRKDASLMGPHKHDAVLSLSAEDLQDIVNVLKPHYAGVVGSFGPLKRPRGAASAAQGPASAQKVWEDRHAVPPGFPGYESDDAGVGDPSTVPGEALNFATPRLSPKDLEPGPQQPAPDAAGPDAIHAPDPARAAEEPTAQGLLPVEAYVTREAVVGFRPGADGENLRAWLADRLPDGVLPDEWQGAEETLGEWVNDWARSLNGQRGPDDRPYDPDSVEFWSGGLIPQTSVWNLWQKMPDVGGSPIQLIQGQSTSRDDIEMTDYPSPQQPSPGATGWEETDAFDPASVSASGGSAVGGGAGLVSVVGPDQSQQASPFSVEAMEVDADRWQSLRSGQGVDAAEVDASGPASVAASGGGDLSLLGYRAPGEDGRAWSALSALVAADPSGVGGCWVRFWTRIWWGSCRFLMGCGRSWGGVVGRTGGGWRG
ncbi:LuxR C-terminal-related transcriptional regulator [Micromonospora olivasterospora]|uniref:Regulatory LuxR family protein n=1 Tax=Micromonospora olivasterospora TaxID=1880 RepID=A0A562IIB9_MICOL|nr:LuxR C-terminal-related transcriptional regulator [Micromonospora olivasterospora]TWH70642.1 regulatory LuxR family protein [Micromonospora olivasterospora]